MTPETPPGLSDGPSATRLRDHFLGWQCRLRQHAVRHYGGRPSPGMRPRVTRADESEIAPAVTVVLVEAEPGDSIALFRHIVRKTHDPERRYRDGLQTLSSAYFQRPGNFSDVMTAVFPVESPLAETMVSEARCVLEFEQFSQSYRIPCGVGALAQDDPAYQATYWHNQMFNPTMPGVVRILAFTPDWRQATASPPI
ncbi:MAG: hypothetical protein ACE5LF_04990 [Alphaproteobacteria bacterium]